MPAPYLLSDEHLDAFPDVVLAMDEPNGLLSVGGNLSTQRLLAAYAKGIFPWYSDGQPIMWWSPDPRAVIRINDFTVSRRLKKTINKNIFHVSLDTEFKDVISDCTQSRKDGMGTWITTEMQNVT